VGRREGEGMTPPIANVACITDLFGAFVTPSMGELTSANRFDIFGLSAGQTTATQLTSSSLDPFIFQPAPVPAQTHSPVKRNVTQPTPTDPFDVIWRPSPSSSESSNQSCPLILDIIRDRCHIFPCCSRRCCGIPPALLNCIDIAR
jgi:hypothetical protein